MITNNSVTIYHKGLDEETRLEKYTRYNYSNIWWFDNKVAKINQGYNDDNRVHIRIPYDSNLDIKNFAKGDIIVQGTLDIDIQEQQDLSEYLIYNIANINDNNFGRHPHIHIGGK